MLLSHCIPAIKLKRAPIRMYGGCRRHYHTVLFLLLLLLLLLPLLLCCLQLLDCKQQHIEHYMSQSKQTEPRSWFMMSPYRVELSPSKLNEDVLQGTRRKHETPKIFLEMALC